MRMTAASGCHRKRENIVKIKRKDGQIFEMECISYRRGEWGYRIVKIDGVGEYDFPSDPSYTTERECRRAARHFAENAAYHRGLGWCL